MAHHLAELLSNAELATGADKEAAENQAVELILKLWAHRRVLPESADPVGGYRDAIDVLSRMMPEADPWARRPRTAPYEEILHHMFECMTRVVLSGIRLTQISNIREVSEAERSALDSEEIELTKALEEWTPFAPAERMQSDIVFRVVGLTDDEGNETGPPVEPLSESESEHKAIVEDLERIQKHLADLLDQWKAETSWIASSTLS